MQTNQTDLVRALRTLVHLCPAQIWAEPIHKANLFAYFLKILDDDTANVLLLTDYVLLFARVAINDPLILSQLLAASASVLQKPETALWEALLDQWWRRVCRIYSRLTRYMISYAEYSSLITCMNPANANLWPWV